MWVMSALNVLRLGLLSDPDSIWEGTLFDIFASIMSLGYFVFLIWMLVHCYRSEPDWQFWFWIMIIAPPIGPLAYFAIRFLPSIEFPLSVKFNRWTRQRELMRLEIAAEQIGNPYQFVLWGDALRDVKLFDRARDAYSQAIAKDPINLQALWGAAQIALVQKRYTDVRSFTGQILAKDPEYKFGDVLLAHARALNELGEQDEALRSLEQHVRRWRHPESLYLMAEICDNLGDQNAARQHLTTLLKDLYASPAPIARKYGRWKSRANRMLRKLPASESARMK